MDAFVSSSSREQRGESGWERADSLALALSPSAAWRSPVKDGRQQRGDSTADRGNADRSRLVDSIEQRGRQRGGQREERSTSATPPAYEVEVGDGDESPDFFDDSDD
jgi:hypothetical protein